VTPPPRNRAPGGTKTSGSSPSGNKKAAQKATKKVTKKVPKQAPEDALQGAAGQQADDDASGSPTRRSASAPTAAARPRTGAVDVARRAAEQLAQLIRREPGEVTQLERTDDGWAIHVEVLELRRIPDTMDMMALYEVTADDSGSLEGYRRLRRYVRGVPGEE